jgi:hypothetical protein
MRCVVAVVNLRNICCLYDVIDDTVVIQPGHTTYGTFAKHFVRFRYQNREGIGIPISATCSRRDDDVRAAAPSRYRLSLQPLLERSSDLGRAEQRSPSQLKISDISLSLQFPKKPRTYSATRKKNLETGFRVDIPLLLSCINVRSRITPSIALRNFVEASPTLIAKSGA